MRSSLVERGIGHDIGPKRQRLGGPARAHEACGQAALEVDAIGLFAQRALEIGHRLVGGGGVQHHVAEVVWSMTFRGSAARSTSTPSLQAARPNTANTTGKVRRIGDMVCLISAHYAPCRPYPDVERSS
jgi:hypothetical protein